MATARELIERSDNYFEMLKDGRRPEITTVVSGQMTIGGIVYDAEKAEHQVLTEPDCSLTMHRLQFEDGSEASFEVNDRGEINNFISSAAVDCVDGVIYVAEREPKLVDKPVKKSRKLKKRRQTIVYPQPGVDI